MKVEVNRNDEMPKAGDLVIDELGNIGILMHNGYIWLLKHSGKPVDVPTLVSYTDSDMPEKAGSGWQGMNNDYEWTSATDDVFKDCVIPATTFDKGPLQFEIDEQLNTTWYKE